MKHQSSKKASGMLPYRNHLGNLTSGKIFSAHIEREKDGFEKNYSRTVKNGFINLKKK